MDKSHREAMYDKKQSEIVTGDFFWCYNCYVWTQIEEPSIKGRCRSCGCEWELVSGKP